ncbi:RAD55 family ATPase [Natranaeroarchaeum sulfidigenes]|uniref:RecA-superfamily ATPase implicated in signal transduction n=1 Tax=Natranaeroarchaeum sulfidigenes TaxID=2784880 RepID=A0A897MTJ3_9EURY|nr:HTR-like protein [Natranaeroarchaeum sulfidigenes]QSG01516.1 RecA-superfamily ATPase implicated in signal transduction [Natranaeroarchaeum sulfidigenes]
MSRIPFGISQFDRTIGGGAPSGSVVLLAGEVGAGAREFIYTTAVMNGLARADQEQFDLYYGDLHDRARLPEEVHYLSFTSTEGPLLDEMRHTLEADLVETGTGPLRFGDLSEEYFQLSPVPSEWYSERTRSITSLGQDTDTDDVLDAMGDYLTDHAAGSLVVVDSVTDLISAAGKVMDWTDITLLLKGLEKAANQWGGLILLHVTLDTLSDTELGQLMDATNGTFLFEWESGGSERDRTMVVKQFRGVLSRLEDENIVRFETDIGDTGFDISDVRKIR